VALLLVLFVWFLAEAAFFALGVVLALMLLLAAGVVVFGPWLGYEVTGRWPSGQTICALSGTAITLLLAWATQDRWVLAGGVLGTVLAAKTTSVS
jgi:hypothetical protein